MVIIFFQLLHATYENIFIYECLIIFMEFLLFSVLPPFLDNLLQGGGMGVTHDK